VGAKEIEQGRQEAPDEKEMRRKGSDPPRVVAEAKGVSPSRKGAHAWMFLLFK
jgi:hypothetical protein